MAFVAPCHSKYQRKLRFQAMRRIQIERGLKREKRVWKGVSPDSPLSSSNLTRFKKQRLSHSAEQSSGSSDILLNSFVNPLSDQPLPRPPPPPLPPIPPPPPPSFVIPLMEAENKLNLRWRASVIVIVREELSHKKLPIREYEEIAKSGGVGSAKTLKRYVQMVRDGKVPQTPQRKKRASPVLERVHSLMLQKAQELNYHFTHRLMTEIIRAELAEGSLGTIQNVMKIKEWKKTTQQIRPTLTQENMQER